MKKIITLILTLSAICKSQAQENIISDTENYASVPSFTTSPQGKIVLTFAEKDANNKVKFYYSYFDGKNFETKNYIPIVDSASTHAEGMPRLAIKKDGSMVVTFEIKKNNPSSRFGSDLLYVFSKDGKNWTSPEFIQKDRNPAKSSSFSKPVRLADGEIGVIWLDEKLTTKGRSVKFIKTLPGGGFGEEKVIDNQACECCRIEAITDKKGFTHIFYRDMFSDGSRDIGYIVTKDSGNTFSKSKNVYPDKWKIDACPHSGPTATESPRGIWISWFTGTEKATGIKVCDVKSGKIIKTINSLSVKAPQLTTTTKGETFWVYSSTKNVGEDYFSTIALEKVNDTKPAITLSNDFEMCNYPAITANGKDLLIAYERKGKNAKQQIVWKVIEN